jgi:hypothetical protein
VSEKQIPYEFVLDHLISPEIIVKSNFGMHYVYSGERIVLMLRRRENDPGVNGIWVATYPEHVESLRKELPSLCSFSGCGRGVFESGWQLLPDGADDFETSALQVCRLIMHGDKRIGRVVKKAGKRVKYQ